VKATGAFPLTRARSSPNGHAAVPRLASLPRRRRPLLVLLAVCLVAAGGAVAFAAASSAGRRTAVLAVARPVSVGNPVGAADVTTARIPTDVALRPIPVQRRDSVIGQVAAVDLRPGTLLTADQLTAAGPPLRGQVVVGVLAKPGQLPARPLVAGDLVLAVSTATGTGGTTTTTSTTTTGPGSAAAAAAGAQRSAEVLDVRPVGVSADGVNVVDLLVAQPDGPGLAGDAAAGRISLLLLPRSG
jgi:SAF domain